MRAFFPRLTRPVSAGHFECGRFVMAESDRFCGRSTCVFLVRVLLIVQRPASASSFAVAKRGSIVYFSLGTRNHE
jgi:hypothetical protein